MDYVYYSVDYSNSLSHHGIKGQKWGVRRYQDSNGNWTEEGLKRRRSGGRRKLKSTSELKKNFPDLHKNFTNEQIDNNDLEYLKAYDSWERLDGDIRDTSYDWYNGIPKSESMKQLYRDRGYDPPKSYFDWMDTGYKAPSVQKMVGTEKMLGMILNDLGYEDTKQGRDYIRDVVMWD